ncbi:MAG: MBL fold metallo-hydrolase [Desulfobacteraceae bacterium]|jgi:7,8-dihydropterin-6-yl-methyl-4-(beta-D-ribofuranosyl)aminobenzene 5'-phosphate synthase
MGTIALKSVQQVEVTTLMDNYIDILLESTPSVRRPPLAKEGRIPTDSLVAEHGLSLLVKTVGEGEQHTIMLDTGYNARSLIHNMEWLGIDLSAIEAIVISHSHMDHAGALYPVVKKINRSVPLVVHPDIFARHRILKTKDKGEIRFPDCYDRDHLAAAGVDLVERRGPTGLSGDTILVTGEVARVTDFEKGMPSAFVERNRELRPDPISDDQSLIVHLDGKGLVLITGCCHAGLINTLRYAQKITGIQEVHAVLGGLHLSGPAFAPIVERTIEELQRFNPELVVPMHCTGWNSSRRLAEAFDKRFILNSVGTTYILGQS